MKNIFIVIFICFLTVIISACSKSLTSNEQFEAMLSVIYTSIDDNGILQHKTTSNIDDTTQSILEVFVHGVTQEEITLKMFYGSHLCHILKNQDMTHRCRVKIFFEGTPSNSSQFNTSKTLYLLLHIILDGKIEDGILSLENLHYDQMDIITEDYGMYARTDNYITSQRDALNIVLSGDRKYKKAMDAEYMALLGFTHFEFNEYKITIIQRFLK